MEGTGDTTELPPTPAMVRDLEGRLASETENRHRLEERVAKMEAEREEERRALEALELDEDDEPEEDDYNPGDEL